MYNFFFFPVYGELWFTINHLACCLSVLFWFALICYFFFLYHQENKQICLPDSSSPNAASTLSCNVPTGVPGLPRCWDWFSAPSYPRRPGGWPQNEPPTFRLIPAAFPAQYRPVPLAPARRLSSARVSLHLRALHRFHRADMVAGGGLLLFSLHRHLPVICPQPASRHSPPAHAGRASLHNVFRSFFIVTVSSLTHRHLTVIPRRVALVMRDRDLSGRVRMRFLSPPVTVCPVHSDALVIADGLRMVHPLHISGSVVPVPPYPCSSARGYRPAHCPWRHRISVR